ncbi:hypothetical protein AAHA92_16854 [Salvia divinorum]|uniref:Uncharacterized protein n=1 Tax=Salvia divinorum TaxID=28513 RepID=A0ABD1GX31_SALDI
MEIGREEGQRGRRLGNFHSQKFYSLNPTTVQIHKAAERRSRWWLVSHVTDDEVAAASEHWASTSGGEAATATSTHRESSTV